jgi:hypothetical protein
MEKQIHNEEQLLIDELLDGDKARQVTFHATGSDVLSMIKEILAKAQVFKISIWHKERLIVSIPAYYGGLMTILLPFLSTLTAISMLSLNCKIIVDKRQV